MTSMNGESDGIRLDLAQEIDALASGKQSGKKYGDIDILDKCVSLSISMSGWDDMPTWRKYLHKRWSPAAVETSIAKACFCPDLEPASERFHAMAANQLVAMSQLGQKAQFGNQLFQYAWLRLYADAHGLVPAAPYWIGYTLFGLNDPIYSADRELRRVFEFALDWDIDVSKAGDLSGCDLVGYFQMNTSYWKSHREIWLRLFSHAPEYQARMERCVARLRERGDRLVVLHLRQNVVNPSSAYHRSDLEPYRKWLGDNPDILRNSTLYIATDSPGLINEFSEYRPIHAGEVDLQLDAAPWLTDWWACRNADHLVIPNSTFSLSAAMLNENNGQFYRLCPDENEMRLFDPWDTDVLLLPGGDSQWARLKNSYQRKQARATSIRALALSEFRSRWSRFRRG